MPKFGVILSGCGVYDGSEIHEAVFTLLSLDQLGASYQCMAPDITLDTIDHLAAKPSGEKRSVLAESARIARGNVVDLATVKAADFDGFILPGGYGAAKNLCTFATQGPDCTINPQVARVLNEAHALGKPIGLICIAPALGAKLLADKQVKVTIGHDTGTAEAIQKTGATHQACGVNDIVVDKKNRVVSTPAYMEAKSIKEAHAGISKLVAKVVEMAG